MITVRCIVCGEVAGFLGHTPRIPVLCSKTCELVTRERGMNLQMTLMLDMPHPYVDRRQRIPDPSGKGWLEAPQGSAYIWKPGRELASGFYEGCFELQRFHE